MTNFKISVILLLILLSLNSVCAKIITFDNSQNQKSSQSYSIFSRDLNRIEMELFGRTFPRESDEIRINRIENKLYGKTYQNENLTKRMNMILQDYEADKYWANNGMTYCSPNNVLTKLKNALIGQPIGFTPAVVEPSPYLNTYGPSYMRGYYGTNGWRSHNSYNPIYSGAGLHILD